MHCYPSDYHQQHTLLTFLFTATHVLGAVKRRDTKQKKYLVKGFLELHHISL